MCRGWVVCWCKFVMRLVMASTSTRYLSISKRTFVSSLLLGFACAFGLNYMNALRVLLTLIFFFGERGNKNAWYIYSTSRLPSSY